MHEGLWKVNQTEMKMNKIQEQDFFKTRNAKSATRVKIPVLFRYGIVQLLKKPLWTLFF